MKTSLKLLSFLIICAPALSEAAAAAPNFKPSAPTLNFDEQEEGAPQPGAPLTPRGQAWLRATGTHGYRLTLPIQVLDDSGQQDIMSVDKNTFKTLWDEFKKSDDDSIVAYRVTQQIEDPNRFAFELREIQTTWANGSPLPRWYKALMETYKESEDFYNKQYYCRTVYDKPMKSVAEQQIKPQCLLQ